jgi:gliding motility-associated-like protein
VPVNVNWSPSTHLNCTDCFEQFDIFTLNTICYTIDIIDLNNCYPKQLKPCIIIDAKFSLDVPTGFTPNGDGINDVVYVRGWGIKELMEFSVFNRWGELLFKSENLEDGWDGTYKSEIQNDETYVYTAKALMWSGEVETKTGYITLIK